MSMTSELVDRLKTESKSMGKYGVDYMATLLLRAAHTIEILSKKARATEQEWIPCSERLPDDNREVLISLEWGIDIGTYERGEWRSEWINHYDDDNVLSWMPLPKPWKGADDEASD